MWNIGVGGFVLYQGLYSSDQPLVTTILAHDFPPITACYCSQADSLVLARRRGAVKHVQRRQLLGQVVSLCLLPGHLSGAAGRQTAHPAWGWRLKAEGQA